MAGSDLRLQVLVSGLLECEVCATVWLFTRSIDDLEKIEQARCRHCTATMDLLMSTVLAVPVVELPPHQTPEKRHT